jgi:glycosyltransferase involved in cell wall biosynthesis
MKSELKLAFLTSEDPNDRVSWSGIYYQMTRSLEKQFRSVTPLGPVKMNKHRTFLVNFLNLTSAIFFRRRYNTIHNKLQGKYYGREFRKKMKKGGFDVIFAPKSSVEIAYLKTKIPIFYYSDTSFDQIKNYYSIFSNLTRFSEKESELIQHKALFNSNAVIHSSKWATDHVIQHYGVRADRAFTVAMGANIDEAPDPGELALKLCNRSTCNLLFLGVEWERKGGPIAFEALLTLIELGLDSTLTICGCTPPEGFAHPNLKVIPFLDKNKIEQYDQFLNLLRDSHFLILPTRAECAGIVFAEASAYGIPSITTDTGGVGGMVENDVNGYRLHYNARGNVYAQLIKAVFEDGVKYEKLVYSSRAKYDSQLNWVAWGAEIKNIIVENYNNSPFAKHGKEAIKTT